jgi:dynamin 1-like protein
MQELMRETEDVAIRRKTCTEMRDLLQRALDIIGEVRDFRPNL